MATIIGCVLLASTNLRFGFAPGSFEHIAGEASIILPVHALLTPFAYTRRADHISLGGCGSVTMTTDNGRPPSFELGLHHVLWPRATIAFHICLLVLISLLPHQVQFPYKGQPQCATPSFAVPNTCLLASYSTGRDPALWILEVIKSKSFHLAISTDLHRVFVLPPYILGPSLFAPPNTYRLTRHVEPFPHPPHQRNACSSKRSLPGGPWLQWTAAHDGPLDTGHDLSSACPLLLAGGRQAEGLRVQDDSQKRQCKPPFERSSSAQNITGTFHHKAGTTVPLHRSPPLPNSAGHRRTHSTSTLTHSKANRLQATRSRTAVGTVRRIPTATPHPIPSLPTTSRPLTRPRLATLTYSISHYRTRPGKEHTANPSSTTPSRRRRERTMTRGTGVRRTQTGTRYVIRGSCRASQTSTRTRTGTLQARSSHISTRIDTRTCNRTTSGADTPPSGTHEHSVPAVSSTDTDGLTSGAVCVSTGGRRRR
ncbi:hypothetical protein DENSPDRAFT_187569 [Dentipellis sp. KUC8613]|nr:hypothetical protein DENSPDRAFT_187569 [Dentipellis sp. KUC8613]